MKKMLALALALIMILSAAAAFADTFKMGIDAEYPPFSYLDDNGNYAGFDVDVCKAVCDKLGWEIEIVPINWDTKLISLDNKEHDCIWSGMTILDTMKEAGYVLSAPYFDNSQVILTKKDSGITKPADLAGKRVAVQLGTSGEELLADPEGQLELAKTFEGGAPITMENFNICATELAAGGVDAVVIDLPVASNKVKLFPDFVILEESLGIEQYGICFRKGDDELCKQVEAALAELVADGTYLEIANKYEDIEEGALLLLKK
jgi:polar amino acid transport system substrate-binding protein